MKVIEDRSRKKDLPIKVIEVVGPAGAGKSTLCNALRLENKSFAMGTFPDVRKISEIPFFMWNGLSLAPTLLSLQRYESRQLTRREFAWLAILRGWPNHLRKSLTGKSRIVILDQGPIYLFAEMYQSGPKFLIHQDTKELWRNLYARWSSIIDLIIYLDADDWILVNRIKNRDRGHIMKMAPSAEIVQFLENFRAKYGEIIYSFTETPSTTKIIRFDTGRKTTDEIVKSLLQILFRRNISSEK